MLPNEIRAPLINHQGRCSQMKSVSHCLKASLPLRSRGSTHRSKERPLGRPDSESVRMGNLLCARALILVLLCASKGVFWVLEQPMSSVMQWHPLFQRMLKLLVVRKMLIKMSNYGGPTEKKTWLYSSLSKLMVYFPNLFGSKSSKSFWVKVPNLPNHFGFGSDSKNHVCTILWPLMFFLGWTKHLYCTYHVSLYVP